MEETRTIREKRKPRHIRLKKDTINEKKAEPGPLDRKLEREEKRRETLVRNEK